MSHISLLHWYLCLLNIFLDVQIFPHTSQGREIPSRCLISMWSLMATNCPSFPHTLQVDALLPFEEMFWLFSIKDFTFASSSWTITLLGTNFWTESVLSWLNSEVNVSCSKTKWLFPVFEINFSFLKVAWGSISPRLGFIIFSFTSCYPVRPFNFKSSAMERKE